MRKYPNGVWFDKFVKDYTKFHSANSIDFRSRLRAMTDLVQLDTMQDNWIVKMRREPAAVSPAGAGGDMPALSAAAVIATTAKPSPSSFSPPAQETEPSDSALDWIKVNVAHIEDPLNIFVHLDILQVRYIQREVNGHGGAALASSSLQGVAYEKGETVGMAIWDEKQGGDGCWFVGW